MNDFITGEKFLDIADFIFAPRHNVCVDCNPIINTFDYSKLRDINLVYTHTFYAKQLFTLLDIYDSKSFVVITHNADTNVDDSYILPDNVIMWFTQNANVISDRIEALPIGLENKKWFKHIRKTDKMEAKLRTEKNYLNLVYMNHNINTNINKRLEPYQILKKKSWVTSVEGKNGHKYDEYLNNIYNHYFVVCPEGNGIDTHRIWETLYMGSYPIVINNVNNSYFSDLPICYIDDWAELTETFLFEWINQHTGHEWNYKKLYFEYWKNKIWSWMV